MRSNEFHESSFSLPGGLLFGEPLSECRQFDTIAIQPLTGREEDWLAGSRGVPSAVVATRLIDACLVGVDGEKPPANFARRILSGDRDYLILQIRRMTLGDDVNAVVCCPACGKDMDVAFDASTISVDGQPQERASYSLEFEAREDVRARSVSFRLPLGSDQECVARLDIDAAAARLLERCVLDDGGYELTQAEQEKVIAAMELVAPAINLELDLVCPECEDAFVFPFDLSAFFFEEMRVGSRQLLNEVHSLAFYYHWTESEILGLVRGRRRSYLALLRETVGEA
jgi:hypothetical protein